METKFKNECKKIKKKIGGLVIDSKKVVLTFFFPQLICREKLILSIFFTKLVSAHINRYLHVFHKNFISWHFFSFTAF